jgi:hypothetical protein
LQHLALRKIALGLCSACSIHNLRRVSVLVAL